MATLQEDEAKKRVQEAVWTWTGRVLVLLVAFGFGMFAGYIAWGAGERGAVALRPRAEQQDAQIVELKNKRVDLDSKLQVTQQRYEECQRKQAQAAQPPAAQ